MNISIKPETQLKTYISRDATPGILEVVAVLYLASQQYLEVIQGAAEWCSWRIKGSVEWGSQSTRIWLVVKEGS